MKESFDNKVVTFQLNKKLHDSITVETDRETHYLIRLIRGSHF